MLLEAKSAQFAPFAALTGYGEAIDETERITEKEIEIGDELKLELNEKLKKLKKNIKYNPKICITYFVKDDKKDGENMLL